jgi:hypothetical protein
MAKAYANESAELGQAKVKNYKITPNGGGEAVTVCDEQNLGGFANLKYYESIFDTTVRVESVVIDASGPTGGEVNMIDKLKMTSGEKVEISMEDGKKNPLEIELIVHNYDYVQDNKGVVVNLNLWHKDMVENEDTKKRVVKHYDQLISNSVSDIIQSTLGTSMPLDVDTSLGKYVFQGNKLTATPFDQCLNLATKCVPDFLSAKGKLAGYLFFQTSEGYKFKSIDKLFAQAPKAKFIYNEKTEEAPPPGYDGKILQYQFAKSMNIEKMVKNAVFSQSEQIQFDPYKSKYKEESPFDAVSQNMKKNNAGKDIPVIADALNFAARTFKVNLNTKDTGQLKPLDNKKSKEQNYKYEEVERQARARYNQLDTSNLTITIPMNFKLHAGDMIEVTFPEPKGGKAPIEETKRKGGKYLIEDLVHKIELGSLSPLSNITTLKLIRDTEGLP